MYSYIDLHKTNHVYMWVGMGNEPTTIMHIYTEIELILSYSFIMMSFGKVLFP